MRQRLLHPPLRCAYFAAFPQLAASASGGGPGFGSARGRRGGKVGLACLRRIALLCALTATLLLGPREARAQARELRWPDAAPRVSTGEKLAAGGLILGTLSWAAFVDEPLGHTRGGVLFDDALRDGLRARGRVRRSTAARTSDTLLYSLLLYPYLDSFVVAPARGSTDVMGQTAWLNTQSFALTWFVMAGTKRLVGRERPYLRGCRAHDGYSSRCDRGARTYGRYSFLSGHASLAFTSAGLTCVHHQHLALYADPHARAFACGAALATATATGALRVVADHHYTTDVLAGVLLGVASGYFLPWAAHYSRGRDDRLESQQAQRAALPLVSTAGVF